MTEKAYSSGSAFPPLQKGKIRLYSMRFCPFAQRARLILALKKVPYERVNISLKEKPEWFLEKNPKGMVPVLEQDDRVLYESLIVAEYLDAAYPKPRALLPTDPYRRARDAMLIDFFGNKFVPNYYKIVLSEGKETEAGQAVKEALEQLEKELTERKSKYFGGQTLSFCDLMIWPWVERLSVMTHYNPSVTLTSFPGLQQWQKAMLAEPAVQECLLPPEMHLSFMKAMKAGDPKAADIGLEA